MNKLLSILFFINSSCISGNLTVVADLSNTLKEVSGTEVINNSNLIWMINDSGNAANLYGLQPDGTIIKEIKINAKNKDWEDLASDSNGNLYIGDFGNNNKKRNKFKILKIETPEVSKKSTPKVISFKLPDTISSKDFEAFFLFHDHFYIFSKGSKKLTVFKVPNIEGNHTAEIISQFNPKGKGNQITSADISDDGKTVVLLNHNKIFKLTNFINDDFFSGTIDTIVFDHNSQKEGVCFKNSDTLYITDEKMNYSGGNLYQISL